MRKYENRNNVNHGGIILRNFVFTNYDKCFEKRIGFFVYLYIF